MRITTKAIQKKLSLELIQLLWNWYDEGYQNIKSDDYQFFQVNQIERRTKLKMWQEDPQAMKIKSIPHLLNRIEKQ
ncbi:DUF960 family protein [Vagococcus carniphilus]|uniref:DUF960 family protein n=1 Tax=Vagococcus carniphilus TaxID=218144 RepID=A0AAW8UDP3_9ENTE|nr:DUF960 family protein [Vagococcus carniphilus]MDT2835075.1 DUF960 family protein [Vagococcus carniphilus]